MRKTLFAKKVSFLLASILIFSVLFTAIVYACSGLDPMRMAFHHGSMDGGTVERGPCSEHKQDICKSVRYRILSIQASASQPAVPPQSSTVPLASSVDTPVPMDILAASLRSPTSFHPFFKIPLTYSYLVLRI